MARPYVVDREAVRRMVVESRAAQGLPPTVEDPATLERIVTIVWPAAAARRAS